MVSDCPYDPWRDPLPSVAVSRYERNPCGDSAGGFERDNDCAGGGQGGTEVPGTKPEKSETGKPSQPTGQAPTRGLQAYGRAKNVKLIRAPETDPESIPHAAKLLGEKATPEDVASIAGAVDGSQVEVGETAYGFFIEVTGDSPAYHAFRLIHRDPDGTLTVNNTTFEIKHAADRQSGFALQVFGREVETARAFGAKLIKTHAARWQNPNDPDDTANGYYTWPRYGYDGPLSDEIKRMLPEAFKGIDHVSGLMRTQPGRDWWMEHGDSMDMTFDLTDGSKSLQVWDAYQKERATRPPAAKFLQDGSSPLSQIQSDSQVITGGRALSPKEIGAAVGAIPGANFRISTNSRKILASTWGSSPAFHAVREIARDSQGNLFVHNVEFNIEHIKDQKHGFALQVFGAQVKAAQKIGAKYLVTTAARQDSILPWKRLNGYYTWARYGYDGPLSARIKMILPESLGKAQRVSELMRTPEGREW